MLRWHSSLSSGSDVFQGIAGRATDPTDKDPMNHSRLLAVIPPLLTMFLGACGKTANTIRTLDDAKHAKIGVMTGTTGEAIAKKRFPTADIKSFDDIMDAVAAMRSGQLDGVVTSFTTALHVSKKNPELTPLAQALADEDTSIALRKGNDGTPGGGESNHRRAQEQRHAGIDEEALAQDGLESLRRSWTSRCRPRALRSESG